MAYKKDINLFKAAGGAVGKSKKMPLTKKLLIVLVAIVIICGGVIGLLMYMQSNQTKELKKLQDQKESYQYTQRATQSLLKDYNSVINAKQTLSFIEFYNELNSNMFSVLSDDELVTIKEYLSNNGYNTQFDFYDVCQELRKQILLAPYTVSNQDDAAIMQESYKIMYSALSNMIDYSTLYETLPEQNEDSIWYSYYRGQFFAVVEGGPDTSTLLQGLTDKNVLGANPFMSLTQTGLTGTELVYEAYGTSVQIDGVDYTIFFATRRSYVERMLDIIENRIRLAIENDYDQTGIDYSYQIGKVTIEPMSAKISFSIQVTQTEVFGLEDIVQAIDESPFFKAEKDLVFDYKDGEPTQEAELVFTIENQAIKIMEDTLKYLFSFDIEE